ncbi:hypothetical protein N0V83_003018 [Neocucurbitaria cava]|uniref:Uncharacterized protein n=1 Tax=Neocucurbitaria cava TaxID=798079 RepID=A0A9W8YG18_9PLEO|nr:hypothetical protein N0V83_003018 [Neocucurbitaria cava]
MSVTSKTSLILSILFFSTSITAAPTRTHCRCTIVSDGPSPAIYTPSSAHWTPSEPSPSPPTTDICFNLGAELENFQDTEPDLYDFYIEQFKSTTSNEDSPTAITTSLNFAARHRLRASTQKSHHDSEPRPTSRPQQRIVCHSEPEAFTSEYQSNFVNLWALQIIIAVSIFACLAEGIHIGLRWMHQRNQNHQAAAAELSSQSSSLRLAGAEKRLLAIPTSGTQSDQLFSPGADKKLRAYASTRYFVTQSSSGKREFIAYEEDDDDEANRPVM